MNYQLPNIVLVARDSIFEQLPEAIFILNEDNHIIDANLAASRLTGMSLNQLYNNTVEYSLELTNDIINTKTDEELVDEIQITRHEFRNKLYLQVKNTPLKDSNKEYCGRIIVITTTTKNK